MEGFIVCGPCKPLAAAVAAVAPVAISAGAGAAAAATDHAAHVAVLTRGTGRAEGREATTSEASPARAASAPGEHPHIAPAAALRGREGAGMAATDRASQVCSSGRDARPWPPWQGAAQTRHGDSSVCFRRRKIQAWCCCPEPCM